MLAVSGPAHASSTHSTDDFDFDADGLCAFTVHLTVHNEIDATTQATAHGSIELDRVVETDMVAANGVTVLGLPYHYTVHRVFDSAGNAVSVTASGQVWRFALPDGGVWSAGGRVGLPHRHARRLLAAGRRPRSGLRRAGLIQLHPLTGCDCRPVSLGSLA